MPFVTEAVWQRLPKEMKKGPEGKEQDMLMVASWPTADSTETY
jgi:valyl-tRNA synthetase